MAAALLVARLILAAVLATAGVAKLADREGTRRSLADFGLPASAAAPLALLLPLVELAVAAALIVPESARFGALAALVLLAAFVAAIGYNLAHGRRPDCHCFGQLSSAPAGWSTVARNVLLGGVAAFVVVGGWDDAGDSAFAWAADLDSAELIALVAGVLLLGVVLLGGWFAAHLFRQQGRLLVRLDALEGELAQRGFVSPRGPYAATGLPIGSPAPDFELDPADGGEPVTLRSLLASGKPAMLVFSELGCRPCVALMPEIARWQREHAEELTVALISSGDLGENQAQADEHGLIQVLVQRGREVSDAYQVGGTPSAVLVGPDGLVFSALAPGEQAIQALLESALGPALPRVLQMPANGASSASPVPAGPEVGSSAADFDLPDLSGRRVSMADVRRRLTLLVFWSPDCGFCQGMVDDLKALEGSPPRGAPDLLFVSSGTVEANRAIGLRSPVLLDPAFETARAYGAHGTPMAVLIDEAGRVASGLAAGPAAVLELARSERAANGSSAG